MTRIQRERFAPGAEGEAEYKKVSGVYRLTAEMIKKINSQIKVMHPLPRFKENLEITTDVDVLPANLYFTQAANGVPMRQAVIFNALDPDWQEKVSPAPPLNLWQDLPIKDGTKRGEKMIYRLDDGTLIDHIEAGKARQVLKVLGLEESETPLVLAQYISSDRYGRKDVIGIHGRVLSEEELSKLGLVSSQATVNIVERGRVEKKGQVVLPGMIEDLIVCPNDRCITQPKYFEHVPTLFRVEGDRGGEHLRVRCHYCGQPQSRGELKLRL